MEKTVSYLNTFYCTFTYDEKKLLIAANLQWNKIATDLAANNNLLSSIPGHYLLFKAFVEKHSILDGSLMYLASNIFSLSYWLEPPVELLTDILAHNDICLALFPAIKHVQFNSMDFNPGRFKTPLSPIYKEVDNIENIFEADILESIEITSQLDAPDEQAAKDQPVKPVELTQELVDSLKDYDILPPEIELALKNFMMANRDCFNKGVLTLWQRAHKHYKRFNFNFAKGFELAYKKHQKKNLKKTNAKQ